MSARTTMINIQITTAINTNLLLASRSGTVTPRPWASKLQAR